MILDDVFQPEDTSKLFEKAVAPMVDDMLQNDRNACIMLYGYSGTGKTFTIFGKDDSPWILRQSLRMIKAKIAPDEDIS